MNTCVCTACDHPLEYCDNQTDKTNINQKSVRRDKNKGFVFGSFYQYCYGFIYYNLIWYANCARLLCLRPTFLSNIWFYCGLLGRHIWFYCGLLGRSNCHYREKQNILLERMLCFKVIVYRNLALLG